MAEITGVVSAKSACIEWTGTVINSGYGSRRLPTPSRGHTTAHRVEWIKQRGLIPSGFHVLHHCDNRTCINIEHLWLGTRQDNMDDMKAKGRQSHVALRGSAHPRAKVSEEDVARIRAAGARPGHRRQRGTAARLAIQYRLPINYIYNLWSGKSWKHVKGDGYA